MTTTTSSGLTVLNLSAGYSNRAVVDGISLDVKAGEIVLLSGANGAGKSTLLRCISGHIRAIVGDVRIDGRSLPTRLERRARSGVILVPEERSIFRTLSVDENLRLAQRAGYDPLSLFPELEKHLNRRAGQLSGGQQQMLSLARALGCGAKFLLIDELTLGLAPVAIGRLLGSLRTVAASGVGVLLVEQHVRMALAIADRGFVLAGGKISMSGDAEHLRANIDEIENAYLGNGRPSGD